MKTSNRFLLGFGIFIVAVVAAAVIIALAAGNEQVKTLPEGSPEGVVQRFLVAVKDQDYAKAYGFLSPEEGTGPVKNTYGEWLRSTQYRDNSSSWKAAIVKSTTNDADAMVEVAIEVFRPGGLFSDPVNSHNVTFVLQKENGKWMIKSPVDLYWMY
jgi:hypothetical protein